MVRHWPWMDGNPLQGLFGEVDYIFILQNQNL